MVAAFSALVRRERGRTRRAPRRSSERDDGALDAAQESGSTHAAGSARGSPERRPSAGRALRGSLDRRRAPARAAARPPGAAGCGPDRLGGDRRGGGRGGQSGDRRRRRRRGHNRADSGELGGCAAVAERSATDHRLVPDDHRYGDGAEHEPREQEAQATAGRGRRRPAERSWCGQARSARCWGAHLDHRAAAPSLLHSSRIRVSSPASPAAARPASAAARSFTDAAYMST